MTLSLQWVLLAALGLGLLLAAEVLRRRLRAYSAAIGYDVRADQHFRYDPRRGRAVELRIEAGALTLPEFSAQEQTAFLELTVSSGFAGRLADPWLETQGGDLKLRHYVERGAGGRRFFNVSAHLRAAAPGQRITLRGVRLAVEGSVARLHLLRGAELPEGPVLVLAPHPDDAEIAAFGLFSARPSWVVTVTLGDAGPSLYGPFLPDAASAYAEKARMRAWDSVYIPRVAVPPPVFTANLGYFDGTLDLMRQAPDRPVSPRHMKESDVSRLRLNPLDAGSPPTEATWRNLVADMRRLLAEARPAAVAMPHPVLDPHPDHRCTTLALLEALADSPASGKLLFYANHLPETELYPVGACDGVVSIPPMLDDSVTFGTVWSLPLDAHTRLRKRTALETHHDLRPPQYQEHRTLPGVVIDALLAPYTYLVQPDIDYVRRAARPNELFFVAEFAEADRIRRDVLARTGGAATATS